MFRLSVSFALAVLLGGCVQGAEEQQFGGSFTEATTQANIEDFRIRMEKHGAGDVLIMESFPPQFRVTGLDDRCEAAREEARALAYVRTVSDCREQAA